MQSSVPWGLTEVIFFQNQQEDQVWGLKFPCKIVQGSSHWKFWKTDFLLLDHVEWDSFLSATKALG